VVVAAFTLLAGCNGDGEDSAPTTRTATTPSTPPAGCPALANAAATVDASTGAGDFDGDGRPDRLVTGRSSAGGPWRVRMELAAGGGGEAELPAAAEAVRAIGGARLDVGPAEAAFAVVGANAAGVNLGLFVLRSCKVERVTLAGNPAEFPVRASAGARSGLGCQVPGLVAYEATTTDGRFYQARTVSYLLVGGILDEAHRATSTLGADDPALKPYSAFSCGTLRLS
jgi:hypothetical protein